MMSRSQRTQISDQLPNPVVYCDPGLYYRYANPAAAAWHGRPVDSIVGRHIEEVMLPGDARQLAPRHEKVLSGVEQSFDVTRRFRKRGTRSVNTCFKPDYDKNSNIAGFFVTLTDVTRLRQAEEHAERLGRKLKLMVDSTPAQACYCDRDDRYVIVNRTMADWFAAEPGALIGKTPREVLGSYAANRNRACVDRVLNGERISFEETRQFPDGKTRAVNVSLIPDIDKSGTVSGYCVVATDTAEHNRAKDRLAMPACQDPLTGLPDRSRFDEICRKEIARSRRYGHPLSLIMCDIDHFKAINDTYGCGAGDVALKEFAQLCVEAARHGIDRVARVGSDEFAIILPETSLDGAHAVAERLHLSCSGHSFDGAQHALRLTCSVGVTSWREEETAEPMLERADRALYAAKTLGRNRVVTS